MFGANLMVVKFASLLSRNRHGFARPVGQAPEELTPDRRRQRPAKVVGTAHRRLLCLPQHPSAHTLRLKADANEEAGACPVRVSHQPKQHVLGRDVARGPVSAPPAARHPEPRSRLS